jgi:hypothetical protein
MARPSSFAHDSGSGNERSRSTYWSREDFLLGPRHTLGAWPSAAVLFMTRLRIVKDLFLPADLRHSSRPNECLKDGRFLCAE